MQPLRILHCPTVVGGNPPSLARAERELGLASYAVAFANSRYAYPVDRVLWNEGTPKFARELKRLHLLWQAWRDYDIIHFNFGETIMPQGVPTYLPVRNKLAAPLIQLYRAYCRWLEMRDLPLLKQAGKGIVVTFQGDDARQGDYCRAHFPITHANEVWADYFPAWSDAHKRYRIAQFARYADQIFSLNPDLLHVLPPHAKFMPYAHIDLRDWQFSEQPRSSIPKVVHAPTHRVAKGTRFLEVAVARLKQEQIPFEFILVENKTNAEAKAIYQQADLLVDQLLAGWYGGLAVELMALGKPVMCYLREEDLHFIPDEMRRQLPIINATPDTIYAILKEWLTVRRGEWVERGRQGRAYVERWHDPLQIAATLKKEYESIYARATAFLTPVSKWRR